MKSTLIQVLTSELKPTHLEVIDESHEHSRRTAQNPETHFKVIIVSTAFEGLTKVKRQQLVYSLLSQLFKNGLHALTQATYTPAEWAQGPQVLDSPSCLTRKAK
jgi:BolA family transcriptional regulator, general stress-responsive regulator